MGQYDSQADLCRDRFVGNVTHYERSADEGSYPLAVRWRGLPLIVGLFVVAISGVLFARGATSGDGSMSFGHFLVVGLVLALVIVVVMWFGVMLAGVDPDAAVIAEELASAPDQRRLLSRWLQRSRWARNVGGLSGITWWVLGTSTHGDLLLCGVGGIAIGSMTAELHHVRRFSGPRTASLDRRSVSDYLPVGGRRRMLVVALLSMAMIVGGVVLDHAGSAVPWGLVSFLVVVAAHLVQRRVAGRPRPALAAGLRHADDLARQLAIDRGLAQPATYCALALLAHGSVDLEPSLGGAAIAMSIGAWLYALYAWWQNRRLGLDSLMDRRQPAPV